MAVAAPIEKPAALSGDLLNVSIGDQIAYDNNLFRLPSDPAYFASVAGLNASREDHVNTASLGLDGQWTAGRQTVDLDLIADDDRYARNSDLDNVNGFGKAVWNWRVGSEFSGQIGVDFGRSLLGFADTTIYSKDLQDKTEGFGSARYQVGPRWAIFGGVLDSDTSFSSDLAKINDVRDNVGDLGIEYATSDTNTIGFEYRFTDASYTHVEPGLNPDYREDTGRFLFGYSLSDKTSIKASAGYLKRTYSSAINGVDNFSGDVWRISGQWQATDKTQVVVSGWRDLNAYVTTGADYFVSTGGSISPIWAVSEKLLMTLLVSFEDHDFESAGADLGPASLGGRRDHLTAEQVGITYQPALSLKLKFSYRHEQRDSNQFDFNYGDGLMSAGFTFTF